MFEIRAYFQTETWPGGVDHPDRPSHLVVSADVKDLETAQQIVARFPKSLRMRATTCNDSIAGRRWGYITLHVNLGADQNNGGVNEAGIKRYRSFRKHAARLGYLTEFDSREKVRNAYRSEAAFEAALGV